MQKVKIIKKIVIIFVIICLGILGYYAYKKFNNPKMEVPAFSMNTLFEKIGKSDLKESITATGTVALAEEHEIYAEGETNKIKTFLVEEGDYIEVGQKLVEYDVDDTKEDLESKIKETKTSLENAQLTLESIVVPLSESEKLSLENSIVQCEKSVFDAQNTLESYNLKISQQQTTIDNAKKDMDKAEHTINDNNALLSIGGISQSEYDDCVDEYNKTVTTYNNAVDEMTQIEKEQKSAEFAVKTAENNLKEAQNKLQTSLNVFSDEATAIKYKQQQNQIKMTQNTLDDYQKELNDLVFSTNSKVSGLVTELCVDEGTYTEENTVMLKIADFDKLIVNASVSEYDAPNIELGQKVEMTSDGLQDTIYMGTVTKINHSASTTSTMMGTETVVPVEISVDNPDGVLKPGYTLDLEIITVDVKDVLTISSSAVKHDTENDEYYVFKVSDDKKLVKTVIEIGIYGEISVEVISGLNENDKIIASPTNKMNDGMELSELMTSLQNNQNTKSQSNKTGGDKDDKNSGFEKMLPSGNTGSSGFSGGQPPRT